MEGFRLSFKISVAAVGLLALSWQTSYAALVEVPGDPTLTLDEETGLQWLDLTETDNLSYDFVVSQLGLGGQFEGFRYATTAEVSTLYDHAGLVQGFNIAEGVNDAAINDLLALLGTTQDDNSTTGSIGFTGDSIVVDGNVRQLVGRFEINYDPDKFAIDPLITSEVVVGSTDLPGVSRDPSKTGNDFGSFLVAVPVPSAVWLFGSGLLGLVGIARRRNSINHS